MSTDEEAGEIVLNTFNQVGTSEAEVVSSLQKLEELSKSGIISEAEYNRRSKLIMEFMEVERVDDEYDLESNLAYEKSLQRSYGVEMLSINFLNCLRDCFLGRYEVD